jgi:hypothetical protein
VIWWSVVVTVIVALLAGFTMGYRYRQDEIDVLQRRLDATPLTPAEARIYLYGLIKRNVR